MTLCCFRMTYYNQMFYFRQIIGIFFLKGGQHRPLFVYLVRLKHKSYSKILSFITRKKLPQRGLNPEPSGPKANLVTTMPRQLLNSATPFNQVGSSGLVVMGGNSHAEGCGFESWHHILDGDIETLFNLFAQPLFAVTCAQSHFICALHFGNNDDRIE